MIFPSSPVGGVFGPTGPGGASPISGWTGPGLGSGSYQINLTGAIFCEGDVDIDIRPGSATNPINLKSRGVIPVAILTTPGNDATTIDPETVCLGDAKNASQRDCTEAHGGAHYENVDGDGDIDLVLHFNTQETGIDAGDTTACLSGETFNGTEFSACDVIRLVP